MCYQGSVTARPSRFIWSYLSWVQPATLSISVGWRTSCPIPPFPLPIACCLALFLFWRSGHEWSLIPIGLWIAFMGLLLEPPSSFSSRLLSPLLTNPFLLYLGRISYSLYLSHILVIIVIQYALLTWAPHLSQMAHFGVLLVCTTAATIAVSTVLYRYLEVPGIHAGRYLASRLPVRRVGPQNAMFSPGRLGLILFVLVILLLDQPL